MPTTIGDVRTMVYAPMPMQTDYPALAPRLPGIPEDGDDRYWSPWNWAITFAGNYTEDGATGLRRLGLVFSDPDGALPVHPRDEGRVDDRIALAAREGLDEWIELLRTWVEVATEQDLDHHHPVYDAEYPGDGLFRWGGTSWLSKELPSSRTRTIRPVTLAQWKDILVRAGRREEPALEHLLARDARASLERSNFRKTAIDAGTAVEIVLNIIYRYNSPNIPRGNQLSQDYRNLNSLQRLFDDVGISYGVSTHDLSEVIDARNKASARCARSSLADRGNASG